MSTINSLPPAHLQTKQAKIVIFIILITWYLEENYSFHYVYNLNLTYMMDIPYMMLKVITYLTNSPFTFILSGQSGGARPAASSLILSPPHLYLHILNINILAGSSVYAKEQLQISISTLCIASMCESFNMSTY